jgi:hypothetical protein
MRPKYKVYRHFYATPGMVSDGGAGELGPLATERKAELK